MNLAPLRHLATHLVGAAAGGALAYMTIASPPAANEPPPAKHRSTTLAAKFSPTVTLELERLVAQAEAERSDPGRLPSIRESMRVAMEKQPETSRHNEQELLRLRALARNFVELNDPGPVLTDALAARDQDTARALFIEWYRRDPAGAFDELATRGTWLDHFDNILALAVPDHDLVAQAVRDDRPNGLRDQLSSLLGAKLGGTDDLPGLAAALDVLDPRQQGRLLAGFTEAWIPDDGAEAARFIGLDMKPAHQALLLEALAEPRHHSYPTPWTDAFTAALFRYDLHVPRDTYDTLVANAAAVDQPVPDPWGGPSAPLPGNLASSDAVDALGDLLTGPLHQQRDYPDLLAADSVTLDEVVAAARDGIPGSEQFPEALARAIFLRLAPHNPARAITWAHATIHPLNLDQDIAAVLEGAVTPGIDARAFEPRARRVAELVSILQPSRMEGAPAANSAERALQQFHDWSRLAPDTASRTLDRIAPGHPIWKFDAPRTTGP